MNQLERSLGESFLAHGQVSCQSLEYLSRNYVPLMPSDNLIYLSLFLSPSSFQSWSSYFNALGAGKGMSFFSSILDSWVLTHCSLFPWCPLNCATFRGRGDVGKVSLTTLMNPNFFFPLMECWSFSRNLDFQKCSHLSVSTQVRVFQVLLEHSWEELEPVQRLRLVSAHSGVVCLLPNS